MRILGFSRKWDKLNNKEFTTFRYPRGDKDWQIGEEVQVVFQPRRKGGGEKLGTAKIIKKEGRELSPFFADELQLVSYAEAVADGFPSGLEEMVAYMEKQYGLDYISCMNKLTLKWLELERKKP